MVDMRDIGPNTFEPGYYHDDAAEQETVQYEASVLLTDRKWVSMVDLYERAQPEMDQAMVLIASGDVLEGGRMIEGLLENEAFRQAQETVNHPDYWDQF